MFWERSFIDCCLQWSVYLRTNAARSRDGLSIAGRIKAHGFLPIGQATLKD